MIRLATAGAKGKLSGDETELRKREAQLFSRISAPPSILESVSDFIMKNEAAEEIAAANSPDKKRQRPSAL